MAKADWSSTTGFVLPSLCQLEGSFGLGSSWFGIGVLWDTLRTLVGLCWRCSVCREPEAELAQNTSFTEFLGQSSLNQAVPLAVPCQDHSQGVFALRDVLVQPLLQ